MTQVFRVKSKKQRVFEEIRETPVLQHHAYVYAYYAGEDEVIEQAPLDAVAFSAWADELQRDDD